LFSGIIINIQPLWKEIPHLEEQKIWAYAPGEGGYKWDEFREKGIMAIGWDEIGDLTQFESKEEIEIELTRIYGPKSSYTNDGLALWQFCNEVQIGDRILAKARNKTLLGIGEVISDYTYDDSREEYKHIRKVNWTKTGRWELEDKFAIKTLTDITLYEEFGQEVEQLISRISNNSSGKLTSYTKQDFLNDVFISEEQYDTLRDLLQRKKNVILQGPSGVGKTYSAKRLAYSIIGEKNETLVKLVQFHQSYSYEDFIMGYRPVEGGFALKEGVFYKFCKKAKTQPHKPHFFIIDEINRGNLSKIFGELLMLIEADKRGEKMILTYNDEDFSVPSNVYIIGMMNTADRSLAIIDYALRRRFCFFDLEPAFHTDNFKDHLRKKKVEESLIDKIVRKFSALNNKIENDNNLGRGFRIGHSYFCDCDKADKLWYDNIVKYEVAPLLQEYWFDSPETVKDFVDELLR